MSDAQKTYNRFQREEDGDKVYIPENIEEYDSDSDSFGEKLRQLTDPPKDKDQGGSSSQIWFVKEMMTNDPTPEKNMEVDKQLNLVEDKTDKEGSAEKIISTLSPEVFISDDNIVTTQDSLLADTEVPDSGDNQDVEILVEASEDKAKQSMI